MDTLLAKVAEEFGTPCYVYDVDFIQRRAADLRASFGGKFQLSYAVKSNPNLHLLRCLQAAVETLDISSGGELQRALAAGWHPELISFTGPGKTDKELQASVDARIGHVIVESVQETQRLSRMAGQAGITQPILLRISPATMPSGFGVNMAGKPCQFGIDEEVADAALQEIRALPHVRVEGFHIYSGTQCLKPGAIAENYVNFVRLFRELCVRHDITPQRLIFGSGLGVPYYQEDTPLTLEPIAQVIIPELDALIKDPRFASTTLALELGRYLVAEAGHYLTSVVSVKHSRGSMVAVCDGGMNHNSAACGHMGSVIPRNYRMSVVAPAADAPRHDYELFGPLCTSIDRLGRKVHLAELATGSVISLECSGAYGITASPVHFISHSPPKEVAVQTVDGSLQLTDVTELKS